MNVTSIVPGRARALLRRAAVLTLDSGEVFSQIAVAAVGDGFVGLVRDDSTFLDRVRRGMDVGFTVFEGELAVLRGRCAVTPRGRASELPEAQPLIARAPFGASDCVLVDITVATLEVDDGDSPSMGAVPRT